MTETKKHKEMIVTSHDNEFREWLGFLGIDVEGQYIIGLSIIANVADRKVLFNKSP